MKGFGRNTSRKLTQTTYDIEKVLNFMGLSQKMIDSMHPADFKYIQKNADNAAKGINALHSIRPRTQLSPRGQMKRDRKIRKQARLKALRDAKKADSFYGRLNDSINRTLFHS